MLLRFRRRGARFQNMAPRYRTVEIRFLCQTPLRARDRRTSSSKPSLKASTQRVFATRDRADGAGLCGGRISRSVIAMLRRQFDKRLGQLAANLVRFERMHLKLWKRDSELLSLPIQDQVLRFRDKRRLEGRWVGSLVMSAGLTGWATREDHDGAQVEGQRNAEQVVRQAKLRASKKKQRRPNATIWLARSSGL